MQSGVGGGTREGPWLPQEHLAAWHSCMLRESSRTAFGRGESGWFGCYLELQLWVLQCHVPSPNLINFNDWLLVRSPLDPLMYTEGHAGKCQASLFSLPCPSLPCADFLLETLQFLVSSAGCCSAFRPSLRLAKHPAFLPGPAELGSRVSLGGGVFLSKVNEPQVLTGLC